MANDGVLAGSFFMDGDTACAEGAICAGCRFFGGYPITPATEIAERMARRMPQVGGTYIQMEDEIASMNAVLGASWAGVRAMTATSGPGFSLMMENLGLGIMTETPCVIVNVQRGSPSTGLPTFFGQADMMQARWGSHGDYEVIALAPSSSQECFDFTIKAFNLSEKYRLPVFILTDGLVGHMTEKVVIPEKEDIKLISRKKPKVSPEKYLMYKEEKDLVPAMASAGMGDALTGAIAGLIAQGIEPAMAAVAATYLHGLAGDMAADEIGDRGIVASDVIRRIPQAIRKLK